MGISIMIGNRIATGKKSGAGYSGPVPLIHYDFSRYSNEDFLNNPDLLVKDLTGNGHDLRLYNFAFSGMSGFGGFVCDFNDFSIRSGATGLTITKSYNKIHIEISEDFSYANAINILKSKWNISKDRTVKVTSTYNDVDNIKLVYSNSQNIFQYISLNGTTFISAFSGTADSYIYLRLDSIKKKPGTIDIELLPEYPGGLISDGVDDYGLCVKDFVLPNDYTICAIRKYPEENIGALCSKSHINASGIFIFEYYKGVSLSQGECASKGYTTRNLQFPELFSYMTMDDYNGKTLRVGIKEDTSEDKLYLFTIRQGDTRFSKVVLYELRIYDYLLTPEELKLVEDDMMSNYEKNAKPLEGITYVADWDAKGRSNDEDVNVGNKWIDKATGKVINLNNFAYAGMSGWNGYGENFKNNWIMDTLYGKIVDDHTALIDKLSVSIQFYKKMQAGESINMRIKITGLSRNISEGKAKQMRIYSRLQAEPNIMIKEDGIYDVHVVYEAKDTLYLFIPGTTGEELITPVVIEQLPMHPGALVFDGVDDYGVTHENVTEQVGTMLIMYNHITLIDSGEHYAIDSASNNDDPNRIMLLYNQAKTWICKRDFNDVVDKELYAGILRTDYVVRAVEHPATDAPLFIGKAFNYNAMSNFALYRLILIKEQLNTQQLEFLKWKVDKEYRDWLKKNNYNIN